MFTVVRYSVMRFCFFFAPARLSGLIASRPMKTFETPARPAFDEARDAVAERVHLDHQLEAQPVALENRHAARTERRL